MSKINNKSQNELVKFYFTFELLSLCHHKLFQNKQEVKDKEDLKNFLKLYLDVSESNNVPYVYTSYKMQDEIIPLRILQGDEFVNQFHQIRDKNQIAQLLFIQSIEDISLITNEFLTYLEQRLLSPLSVIIIVSKSDAIHGQQYNSESINYQDIFFTKFSQKFKFIFVNPDSQIKVPIIEEEINKSIKAMYLSRKKILEFNLKMEEEGKKQQHQQIEKLDKWTQKDILNNMSSLSNTVRQLNKQDVCIYYGISDKEFQNLGLQKQFTQYEDKIKLLIPRVPKRFCQQDYEENHLKKREKEVALKLTKDSLTQNDLLFLKNKAFDQALVQNPQIYQNLSLFFGQQLPQDVQQDFAIYVNQYKESYDKIIKENQSKNQRLVLYQDLYACSLLQKKNLLVDNSKNSQLTIKETYDKGSENDFGLIDICLEFLTQAVICYNITQNDKKQNEKLPIELAITPEAILASVFEDKNTLLRFGFPPIEYQKFMKDQMIETLKKKIEIWKYSFQKNNNDIRKTNGDALNNQVYSYQNEFLSIETEQLFVGGFKLLNLLMITSENDIYSQELSNSLIKVNKLKVFKETTFKLRFYSNTYDQLRKKIKSKTLISGQQENSQSLTLNEEKAELIDENNNSNLEFDNGFDDFNKKYLSNFFISFVNLTDQTSSQSFLSLIKNNQFQINSNQIHIIVFIYEEQIKVKEHHEIIQWSEKTKPTVKKIWINKNRIPQQEIIILIKQKIEDIIVDRIKEKGFLKLVLLDLFKDFDQLKKSMSQANQYRNRSTIEEIFFDYINSKCRNGLKISESYLKEIFGSKLEPLIFEELKVENIAKLFIEEDNYITKQISKFQDAQIKIISISIISNQNQQSSFPFHSDKYQLLLVSTQGSHKTQLKKFNSSNQLTLSEKFMIRGREYDQISIQLIRNYDKKVLYKNKMTFQFLVQSEEIELISTNSSRETANIKMNNKFINLYMFKENQNLPLHEFAKRKIELQSLLIPNNFLTIDQFQNETAQSSNQNNQVLIHSLKSEQQKILNLIELLDQYKLQKLDDQQIFNYQSINILAKEIEKNIEKLNKSLKQPKEFTNSKQFLLTLKELLDQNPKKNNPFKFPSQEQINSLNPLIKLKIRLFSLIRDKKKGYLRNETTNYFGQKVIPLDEKIRDLKNKVKASPANELYQQFNFIIDLYKWTNLYCYSDKNPYQELLFDIQRGGQIIQETMQNVYSLFRQLNKSKQKFESQLLSIQIKIANLEEKSWIQKKKEQEQKQVGLVVFKSLNEEEKKKIQDYQTIFQKCVNISFQKILTLLSDILRYQHTNAESIFENLQEVLPIPFFKQVFTLILSNQQEYQKTDDSIQRRFLEQYSELFPTLKQFQQIVEEILEQLLSQRKYLILQDQQNNKQQLKIEGDNQQERFIDEEFQRDINNQAKQLAHLDALAFIGITLRWCQELQSPTFRDQNDYTNMEWKKSFILQKMLNLEEKQLLIITQYSKIKAIQILLLKSIHQVMQMKRKRKTIALLVLYFLASRRENESRQYFINVCSLEYSIAIFQKRFQIEIIKINQWI